MSLRNKFETFRANTYSWEQDLKTTFKIVIMFPFFPRKYIKYVVPE